MYVFLSKTLVGSSYFVTEIFDDKKIKFSDKKVFVTKFVIGNFSDKISHLIEFGDKTVTTCYRKISMIKVGGKLW